MLKNEIELQVLVNRCSLDFFFIYILFFNLICLDVNL